MTEALHYIHIEGMDFAGKSVVANEIASRNPDNWQIWNNTVAPHMDNPIALLADRLQQEGIFDSEIHGMLYNAAIVAEIRSFIPPSKNTIQDSCAILRSLAYHIVTGKERLEAELRIYLPEFNRFTQSYMLTADHQTRLARLASRYSKGEKISEHDLMFIQNPERFYSMERCLVELVNNVLAGSVIDTSGRNVNDIAQIILRDNNDE